MEALNLKSKTVMIIIVGGMFLLIISYAYIKSDGTNFADVRIEEPAFIAPQSDNVTRATSTESSTSTTSKIADEVKLKISFKNPESYKGKFVDGWPPSKDRYMPLYIQPEEDTFQLRPSKAHLNHSDLLVVVQSPIEGFRDRQAIRDTWMRFATDQIVANVSVIFLIGSQNAEQSISELTKQRILIEGAKHGDILQANLVDHYNNLTLKSVFALKFFMNESNFGSSPPSYVMKIDTDTYLNLPQLVSTLKKAYSNQSMIMLGHKFGTKEKPPKVIKDSGSKWWVPSYLFDKSAYPVILSGGPGYVITRKAAACLYRLSMALPFFHLEDVFLTGFAAENCGVERVHSDAFHPNSVNIVDLKMTDISWHYLPFSTIYQVHKMFFYDDLLEKYLELRDDHHHHHYNGTTIRSRELNQF